MEPVEKTSTYRTVIQEFLKEYSCYKPSHGEIEIQTLFDNETDHYQVVGVGWDRGERIYGVSIHLDIKDGKIWIQVNNTEIDLGQELVERGVAKNDIVIGFQPPYIRVHSGYAIV